MAWVDVFRKALGWLSAGVIPPVTPVDERTVYSADDRQRRVDAVGRQRLAQALERNRYTRAER